MIRSSSDEESSSDPDDLSSETGSSSIRKEPVSESGSQHCLSPGPFLSSGTETTTQPPRLAILSPALSPLPTYKMSPADEADRTLRLKLYVLVARCIAYPFASEQRVDPGLRHPIRMTEGQLRSVQSQYENMLTNADDKMADEAFLGAIEDFYERVLMSRDVETLVKAGGWAMKNFSIVFAVMARKIISELELSSNLTEDRVLSVWVSNLKLPTGDGGHNEGLHRNAFSSSQLPSFDLIMSPDQLYDVFQEVLGISKREHLGLFNTCQLGNDDEQASALRRETQARLSSVKSMQSRDIQQLFVKPNMSIMYIKEQEDAIAKMMHQLDVRGGKGSYGQTARKPKAPVRPIDDSTDAGISKSDIVMPFNVEVYVQEAKGLSSLKLSAKKVFYAVMKVDGCQEKMMTDRMEGNQPVWETEGNFATIVPRPQVRIELFTENTGFLEKVGVGREDKKLAKHILSPTTTTPIALKMRTMDCLGQSEKVYMMASAKIDRPDTMKKAGFVYVKGNTCWKKWKQRYLCLVQVTPFKFALCSFEERHSIPKTVLHLDNYTVDYCETEYVEEGNAESYHYQFRADREGNSLLMGCKDERDRYHWVMALYRATGQQHKPAPISGSSFNAKPDSGGSTLGLDDFLQMDVTKLDHKSLFETLLSKIVDHRLAENTINLGWMSPGQKFVLDEYCFRYGVRSSFYQLCLLRELIDRSWKGAIIDPSLFHIGYTFVEAHMRGFKPDNGHTGSILHEEELMFQELREDLKSLMIKNVRNFWSMFPFGFPHGALKCSVQLLEKVLVPDKTLVKKLSELEHEISECLKAAGLKAYTAETEKAERKFRKLCQSDELDLAASVDFRSIDYLAELSNGIIWMCIEVEHFHAEAFRRYSAPLNLCLCTIWELFCGDLQTAIASKPTESWEIFDVFYKINHFLIQGQLCNSPPHLKIQSLFLPLVVDYLNQQEEQIGRDLVVDLAEEEWETVSSVRAFSEILRKIGDLLHFVDCLKWPDEAFRTHLGNRVNRIAADAVESCTEKTKTIFMNCYQRTEFGQALKYLVPQRVCAMIGAVQDLQTKALPLCKSPSAPSDKRYRSDISEAMSGFVQSMKAHLLLKLSSNIDDLLGKLSRYDRGSLLSPFKSLFAPKLETIEPFSQFVNRNLAQLECAFFQERDQFMLSWYNVMVKRILDFVNVRTGSLRREQIVFIDRLQENLVGNFLEYGLVENDLKSQLYTLVQGRIQLELSSDDLLSAEKDEMDME
eukprot:m.53593 g.53593  ORF g.53593 m.53593 type:complete len:1240 (+) comp34262_c1_seq1:93-3812(+)